MPDDAEYLKGKKESWVKYLPLLAGYCVFCSPMIPAKHIAMRVSTIYEDHQVRDQRSLGQ